MPELRDVLLAPLLAYQHDVRAALGVHVKLVLEVDTKTLGVLAASLDHGLEFEGPLVVSGGAITVRAKP